MKPLLLIVGLFLATPAFGQTKVYTNADLGHPLSPNRGTVSAEQLASLAAHQFRVPQTFDGPRLVHVGSNPTAGPFSDYQNVIEPRRLDGSLWSEPQWQANHGPVFYPGFYRPYGPYAGGHRARPSARSGASRRPSRGR